MASRFFFMPGMAPPNGGPDAILIKGTKELNAVYEVSTGAEARTAVAGMAAKGLKHVKIWVDDRRGTYPKMTPEVYNAVIDEAHKHGMLVNAHAIQMADQKAVVRAGADVLVHTVQNEPIDEELMALLREKKPYWTTVIGLGDRSEACKRRPVCRRDLSREGPRGNPREGLRAACLRPRPTGSGSCSTTSRSTSRAAPAWSSARTRASMRGTPSDGRIITRCRDGCSPALRQWKPSLPPRHARRL